jgi:hypothetical protein
MAVKALTFHLPKEASLSNMLLLIDGISRAGDPSCASAADLRAVAAETHDLPQRGEITNFALRLGLITDDPFWQITDLARAILLTGAAAQPDLLHFLAYVAWSPEASPSLVPFWSYSHTVDALWQKATVRFKMVKSDHAGTQSPYKAIVEEVVGDSRTLFEGVEGFNPEKVSFSDMSVRTIARSLEALQPPAIISNVFARRQTCSAELIALALGEAASRAGLAPGSDLLLSQDRREAVCRICVLDPGYLDRLLDWAIPRFPGVLAPGMRGGSYGRSVRLLRFPSVEDLGPR